MGSAALAAAVPYPVKATRIPSTDKEEVLTKIKQNKKQNNNNNKIFKKNR